MKLSVLAATIAFFLWGAAPAFAGPPPDVDADGVPDSADNCIAAVGGANPAQDDTDGDSCGNICDPDYDQNGVVDLWDLFLFLDFFTLPDDLHNHTEPVGTGEDFVDLFDLFVFLDFFTLVPGPSGTTLGTTACPN
jgi:hypothetical protein